MILFLSIELKFVRLMSFILKGMEDVYCYLDDLLIFSKNEEEHLATLEELFRRLDQNDLTISLQKCEFAASELDFLGYRVNG